MSGPPPNPEALAMVARLGAVPAPIARAMERVPRHRFIAPIDRVWAYEDRPIPIEGVAATVSAPHMIAVHLAAARLAPGIRVLEAGSGSGYLAALLAELVRPGGHVVGVEIEPVLAGRSRARLAELGYGETVTIREGDALDGAPDLGPFDRILGSFAVDGIPPTWRAQLAFGGLVIAPVGGASHQRLETFGPGPDPVATGPDCRFVPAQRPRAPIYRPS